MFRISLVLFSMALVVQGCASSEQVANIVKPSEVDNLGYFSPISHMGIIEKGNVGTKSPLLSQQSARLLDSLLLVKKPDFKIDKNLNSLDSLINIKLNQEINFLISQAITKRRVFNVDLTTTIDSVMEANQQRFALAMIATGFSRAKGNYGGQVAKGIGVGLLTMGMYVPVPVKSNSTIHAVIFDSQNNTVALYKSSQLADKDPMDMKVVSKQMNATITNLLKNPSQSF